MRSDDSGGSWDAIGGISSRADVFQAGAALSSHHCYSQDFSSVLTVTPITPNADLFSVTEDQFYSQHNLAAYGADGRWEIISFRTAVDNTGTFTLRDFLRGLYGSEWASGLHQSGDLLIMLNATTIGFFGLPSTAIGSSRIYRAITNGSSLDSAADMVDTYDGINIKPLNPTDLSGEIDASSNWSVVVSPRSRLPVEVFSGRTMPTGETISAYEFDVYADGTYANVVRTFASATPGFNYTSAQQIADLSATTQTLYLKSYQMSAVAGRGIPLVQSIARAVNSDPYAAYVKLLLHMDGANGSSAFTDVCGNTVTATNAVISTLQSKFGGSSAFFDGSNDRLSIPTSSSGFNFAGNDFTVEFWYYPVSAVASDRIMQTRDGDVVPGIYICHNNATEILFHVSTTGSSFYGSGVTMSVTQNVWQHIAFVRSGSNLMAFKDGTQVGSTYTVSGSLYYNSTDTMIIGGQSSGRTINGYLDEFRITNGAARYTSNFTPPATAFPNP